MRARIRPETLNVASTAKALRTNSGLPPATIGRPELLIDGSDQKFRTLIHGLLTFFALHEAIRDSYAAHVGLGGVQYTILQSIRHLGSRFEVNVRDVAEHLRLSGSFVTVETNKLETLGLVHKEPAQNDRRRVSLKVTNKGAALLNGLAHLQRTVNDVQFANIDRDEFVLLCRLVEQLIGSSQAALTLLHYLKGAGGERALQLKRPEKPRRNPAPRQRRVDHSRT